MMASTASPPALSDSELTELLALIADAEKSMAILTRLFYTIGTRGASSAQGLTSGARRPRVSP